MNSQSANSYDVVIMGGALAGSATAILLLRRNPKLRVLIVEKSDKFSRRVGEATVEVSTFFLQRCLGLTHHLHQNHLVKNGLRFWFANERTQEVPDCSEIGGKYLSRVGAYLVDRAVLDQAALDRATDLGAELWRPAMVTRFDLEEGGQQRLTVARGEDSLEVSARWIVDASGVAALIARKQGWLRAHESHPTAAAWARWRGCVNWDDPKFLDKYPKWSKRCFGLRGTATNHMMGDGWWAWWIPLRGDEISIGLVFDQRFVDWGGGGTVAERLKNFLLKHPVGGELLKDAECVEGDVHFRRNLAYTCDTVAGDGFALVGDASGFMDPFYSPGLDWLAFTTYGAAQLILDERAGRSAAHGAATLNQNLRKSYRLWFDAIYLNKYEYLGEYDLMRIAVQLDIANYYMGVAIQPYFRGEVAFTEPCFSQKGALPFQWWISVYNRRLAAIARSRRRRGKLGRTNDGRRLLLGGFAFNAGTVWLLIRGTLSWIALEISEGWRTWFAATAEEKAPTRAREKEAAVGET